MEDYDDYQEQEHLQALYLLHSAEAISEFSADRLKSAYRKEPMMAVKPANLLERATSPETNPVMSFLYCVIATEITIMQLLTRPILTGLVHSDAVVDMVLKLMPDKPGSDELKNLLFEILAKFADIDLKTYRRYDATETLWQEWRAVSQARHKLMHNGDIPSAEVAAKALRIANEFLQVIFGKLLDKVGLWLNGHLLIEG